MSTPRILFVFRSAPHSTAAGQEGLDAVLAGAAYHAELSVLFVHDGVFQIRQNQHTDGQLKNYTRTFAALADFGVEQMWVDEASLMARGLLESELQVPVQLASTAQAAQLLREHDQVLVF